MARTGQEAKPAWRDVPAEVRSRAGALLGARVVRAERAYGGYAPSATFRLRLEDGRWAFFKGSYPLPPGSPVRFVLDREGRVYRDAGHLISPWAPEYYGGFGASGWRVILLEDVGPPTAPPWSSAQARAAMQAYGALHRRSLGAPLPRWRPPESMTRGELGRTWRRLEQTRGGATGLAALAGEGARDARAWLRRHGPALDRAARALADARGPHALLHLDTRSDNVRVHPGAAVPLRIFDWPFACAGPPELDVAAFAQSVTCEGGPSPERLTGWYGETHGLRPRVLTGAASAIAGFFALRAWRPPVDGLPRLRQIQRCQLKASLAWAARLLDLPEPRWLEQMPS